MSGEEAEKNFWVTIFTSILFSVFGCYLLYQLNATIELIGKGISIIILGVAIFGIFKYIIRKDKTKKIDVNLIYGVICLIASILLFVNPLSIKGFVPMTVGLIMIINLILKLGYLKQVRKNESKDFGPCLLIFIFMITSSILVVFNPLKEVLNINQSMGIFLIFYAVLDTIMCYLFKNNIV